MPMTREMSRGPMPDPVHAPPAHGFDEVTDQITYLSVRPDLTGVLPANYAHPALGK